TNCVLPQRLTARYNPALAGIWDSIARLGPHTQSLRSTKVDPITRDANPGRKKLRELTGRVPHSV
ncbi:MAG: hypothetical protein AAF802_30635, partial [Planctomycetota bacterium]